MFLLFLETQAAKQIDAYVAEAGGDADELKRKCYENTKGRKLYGKDIKDQKAYDDWWVKHCLDEDSHKEEDIDSLMIWRDTPEGQDFWAKVNRY